jgi:hypothetical protein
MSASIIPCAAPVVNPRRRVRRPRCHTSSSSASASIVPAGPLDNACTEIALLAHDLAQIAAQRRTARAVSAALAGHDAAVAMHRLNERLAWLLDEREAA